MLDSFIFNGSGGEPLTQETKSFIMETIDIYILI